MTNIQNTLQTISNYLAALASGNSEQMSTFCSPNFVLDLVHDDAFVRDPLSVDDMKQFWEVWFDGFSEMDWEVERTIAAETVVVVQWTFTGTHDKDLPIFRKPLQPTGKTISFRGVSIYDVADGFIQRETTYMDLATVMVELGVKE